MVIEVNVCACWRVKSFQLASEMNFFGEAISWVDSPFASKIMSADWLVDRNFRSVFNN